MALMMEGSSMGTIPCLDKFAIDSYKENRIHGALSPFPKGVVLIAASGSSLSPGPHSFQIML